MPEHTPGTRILRDDLLAQLRAASHPVSTTELRRNAAKVPVNGLRILVAPIQEQIYRVLCALHRDGLVTRGSGDGRGVTWAPAPGTADEEIAALEAALTAGVAESAHGPSATPCIAAAHLEAAARTATCAMGTSADSAAVSSALSEVVTGWADVLTAVSRHPRHDGHGELIAAAIRTAGTEFGQVLGNYRACRTTLGRGETLMSRRFRNVAKPEPKRRGPGRYHDEQERNRRCGEYQSTDVNRRLHSHPMPSRRDRDPAGVRTPATAGPGPTPDQR